MIPVILAVIVAAALFAIVVITAWPQDRDEPDRDHVAPDIIERFQ